MTTATPTSDLFFGLTPEHVLEAVEAGGLRTNAVCYPLNSFENRVYEVELVDRSRAIVKFYRPGRWSAEQILEEHAFLADLAAEEVPVGTVRPFPDGATLREKDGIWYAISDRRGGRAPDELDEPLLRRLGRLVARVHNVGARRAAVERPRLDADRYVRRNLSGFASMTRCHARCASATSTPRKPSPRSPIGGWPACPCIASTPISISATCCCATACSPCSTSTTS